METEAETATGGGRGMSPPSPGHTDCCAKPPTRFSDREDGRREAMGQRTAHSLPYTLYVHVPKQGGKHFTRCALYTITAQTSNF